MENPKQAGPEQAGTKHRMNFDRIVGRLSRWKGWLLREWGLLVADDYTAIVGTRDRLIGRTRYPRNRNSDHDSDSEKGTARFTLTNPH